MHLHKTISIRPWSCLVVLVVPLVVFYFFIEFVAWVYEIQFPDEHIEVEYMLEFQRLIGKISNRSLLDNNSIVYKPLQNNFIALVQKYHSRPAVTEEAHRSLPIRAWWDDVFAKSHAVTRLLLKLPCPAIDQVRLPNILAVDNED